MPLPEQIDKRIRQRFDELIAEGEELLPIIQSDIKASEWNYHKQFQNLNALAVKTCTLVSNVLNYNKRAEEINARINLIMSDHGQMYDSPINEILGILKALKSDFEAGMLDDLADRIEANVIGDYLIMSRQLLGEGVRDRFDHVPAAVLAGAVLENALRAIALRQEPPLNVKKNNGDNKALNALIDDLRKIDYYNEIIANQLRTWARIRNAAAHGQFDEFNRQQVEMMVSGVEQFLAQHL